MRPLKLAGGYALARRVHLKRVDACVARPASAIDDRRLHHGLVQSTSTGDYISHCSRSHRRFEAHYDLASRELTRMQTRLRGSSGQLGAPQPLPLDQSLHVTLLGDLVQQGEPQDLHKTNL
jgi:hypothetical protein